MTEKEKQSEALSVELAKIEAQPLKIVIKTPDQLQVAVLEVKKIKAYKAAAYAFWDPLCETANKTHKALTTRRKEFIDPAEKLEKVYKLGMDRFHEADEKKRAEEQRLRVEAAEKAAAEKRVAEVEETRGMGELEAADHLAQQPLDVTPVAAPVAPKVEGMSTSKNWHAEIVDLPEFLTFLAENPMWFHLIQPIPMKELNRLAISQKELFKVPGCKAVAKIGTSIRG